MLPRRYRLPGFRVPEIVKQGTYTANATVYCKYQKQQEQLSYSRFAFVIPGRIAKKATARNRIKRLLSEIIRLHLDSFEGGFDILLFPQHDYKDAKLADIEKGVLSVFKKTVLSKNL